MYLVFGHHNLHIETVVLVTSNKMVFLLAENMNRNCEVIVSERGLSLHAEIVLPMYYLNDRSRGYQFCVLVPSCVHFLFSQSPILLCDTKKL